MDHDLDNTKPEAPIVDPESGVASDDVARDGGTAAGSGRGDDAAGDAPSAAGRGQGERERRQDGELDRVREIVRRDGVDHSPGGGIERIPGSLATSGAEGTLAELDAPATDRLAGVSDEEAARIRRIAQHVRAILGELELDLADPNLLETDVRVAKMYLEMFHGLREGSEPRVTTFPNDENYTGMVMEKKIPFYSMCSHHLVPFYGHAHIAYIPSGRIMGLSKFPRILEFYAKRPQLQERLTEQVITYLDEKLKPQGAMVVIEARHLCVEMRGVKKPGAVTVTSSIRGSFLERAVREEFLDLLRRE